MTVGTPLLSGDTEAERRKLHLVADEREVAATAKRVGHQNFISNLPWHLQVLHIVHANVLCERKDPLMRSTRFRVRTLSEFQCPYILFQI